jgi:Ca2+-binding EF-hand superfamily protein
MRKNTLILGVVATSLALTGLAAPTFAARQKAAPEQRAEQMIKRFDTDGDNRVSLAEFQAGAADAFKAYDTDGDGQVTRSEIEAKRQAFRQARKEIRAAGKKNGEDKTAVMEKIGAIRPPMLPGMRPKAFKQADTDKNGSLSLAEVNEQAAKIFKRRDTNGDGFIDAADFAKKI